MNLLQQEKINIKWIISLLSFSFLTLIILTAWLSDDAFITFRTVDNFINGYGFTWNIGERVQAYTHPLWMLILVVFQFITKEVYFTSIILSIIASLLAFYILIRKLAVSASNAVLVGLILIFSKAFVDYSTSGLENPLSHLLTVLFFVVYFNSALNKNKILFLSLIASFAALSRLDMLIIFLPSLLLVYFTNDKKIKNISPLLAGFIPLFVWELFSLFYYGFLFPNTAYAKLNTGIGKIDLIEQGLLYLLDSLYMDPLTFFTLLAAIPILFIKRKKELMPIAAGCFLYLVYIIIVGGDFMSGRFLSVPLLCSVIMFSRIEINSVKALTIFIITIVSLGFLSPRPNLLSTPNYSLGPKIINGFRFGPTIIGMNKGITDERFWYYENTGLLNNLIEKKVEQHPWAKHGLEIQESKNNFVVKSTVGLFGFYAGKNIHIVDQYGLTEPLLSKLPATEYWLIGKEKPAGEKFWRIGHFARKIPEGYLETLKSGENKIIDPDLAKYYEKLSIIIKGDLWDWNRLKEIWNFNVGKYDYLIDDYNKTLIINR